MSLSDAAGSSAPEAARAAAWVETLRGDWTQLSTAAARAMALADLEVAAATSAAVAEERATTGRLRLVIEGQDRLIELLWHEREQQKDLLLADERRIEAIGAAVGALADRFARYCELTEEVTTPRDEASFRLGIECALDLAVDDLNAALDAPMIEGLWHGELVMPTDITRADAAEALHAFISARLASPGEGE